MSETRPIAVGITPLETRRDVVVDVARRAEELGYAAIYVAEGWGHDAAVLLAEIALKTTPKTVAEDLERWYESGAEMPVTVLPPNLSREELDQSLVALQPR